jgi:hypothetical protein
MKYKGTFQEMNEDFAEFLGIMFGDGCLYLDKKGKYQTAIAFNKKEKDYLYYVKKLAEKCLSPYLFCITELKEEFLLRNNSVFVGEQIIHLGLNNGDKKENRIIIPSIIFNNETYLKRVIRGIFDTDGCVYCKYDKYAQIQFKFGCEESLNSVRCALLKLGFNPTNIQKQIYKDRTSWKIYLVRQAEILKFFDMIQPMNIKHNQRYDKIKSGDGGIRTPIRWSLPEAKLQ